MLFMLVIKIFWRYLYENFWLGAKCKNLQKLQMFARRSSHSFELSPKSTFASTSIVYLLLSYSKVYSFFIFKPYTSIIYVCFFSREKNPLTARGMIIFRKPLGTLNEMDGFNTLINGPFYISFISIYW